MHHTHKKRLLLWKFFKNNRNFSPCSWKARFLWSNFSSFRKQQKNGFKFLSWELKNWKISQDWYKMCFWMHKQMWIKIWAIKWMQTSRIRENTHFFLDWVLFHLLSVEIFYLNFTSLYKTSIFIVQVTRTQCLLSL